MKERSQRGSAILIAMISSLVVAIVISFIMQQSQETETSTRMPRVKSAMAAMESQLLASAYDGTLFTNCVSGDPDFGTPGCKKINPVEIANYQVRIPGSRCSGTGTFCGIQVQTSNYDSGTRQLTARIIYTGEEVAVRPIEIASVISSEAWLGQNANCPAATPLLVGFNSDGTPSCRALPVDCPAGWYVSNFDPMSVTGTNAISCAQLDGTPSCPAGSFISNFQWNGGSSFQVACQPVYNPFVPVPAALGDGTTYSYEAASMGPQATWATTTSTTTTTTTTLPPTTTTLVASCANPTTSPVTLVSRQYCSGQVNPFTGTNCSPIVPYADGGFYHSANTPNSNQSMTIYLTWNSANYSCYYSAYLSTSSTGSIMGSMSGGPIPGFSCGSVDWFNTSVGWGGAPGGMSGGLNILGPGPGYVTCP